MSKGQSAIFKNYCTIYFIYSQLEQIESVKGTDETEMEELRREFTDRIGESDRKLQSIVKV